ncbi:MAG TPA: prepilin peptidase [Ramlibacter sp.]|jgi:leader peptidase (prepilin peptidase)/N-methyltransferase|uniref:prepilin peptidase n=1 Tax=Ramlibacter sp. TaxID=1917967 RepID=UPI002D4C25B7|nr:prepilin peptidase [Ramlibacter sp.]HZY18953.1 prepilin peptidase [Ramlibacter sp.]
MLLSPGLDAAFAGFIGLLVGSFLNVVIYRLPQMLERQWAAECAELSGKPAEPAEPFNLVRPGSRCRQCGHVIRWYENIPVLSWLVLRGRCASCRTPIGVRYPLVELCTAALFAFCIWRFGATWTGVAWSGFCATLLALALIDWDTTLLPDDLTLPLLWAGLIVSALRWNSLPLSQAVWGAVAGYVSLWAVYQGFKLLTGREGMGYGDFKLFAALGAWFGWEALVPIILMASVIGAVIGIAMKFASSLREGGYVPFGPFLAGAGLTALLFGPDAILRTIGL